LESGFSTLYQRFLIKRLQQKMLDKINTTDLTEQMPITKEQLKMLNTFYLFDDKVTAPLHGFTDVNDYYQQASGLGYLQYITKPTLVIHAQDDPFMTAEVIPTRDQLSPMVEYELHEFGGHVGFIAGGWPWKPHFYLEQRIIAFIFSEENTLTEPDGSSSSLSH